MSRALAVIGLAALATACTDDGVSLHVICPIRPELEDNLCVWDPEGEGCVADGVLNPQSASVYRVFLRVESGLKPRARDVPPLGETNGLRVTRARVELRVPSGATIDFKDPATPNPYWVSASGYIDPNDDGAIAANIIGQEYITKLDDAKELSEITAAVQLHGETIGQEQVESDWWTWPIRLERVDPSAIVGECVPGAACVVGQDDYARVCSE